MLNEYVQKKKQQKTKRFSCCSTERTTSEKAERESRGKIVRRWYNKMEHKQNRHCNSCTCTMPFDDWSGSEFEGRNTRELSNRDDETKRDENFSTNEGENASPT